MFVSVSPSATPSTSTLPPGNTWRSFTLAGTTHSDGVAAVDAALFTTPLGLVVDGASPPNVFFVDSIRIRRIDGAYGDRMVSIAKTLFFLFLVVFLVLLVLGLTVGKRISS